MDLTKNFIEDNGVAPIIVCGARWIGHLVKSLRRAINKFGIYLTDLENFGKTEKSENEDRNFCLCYQMARLSIFAWDKILFAPVGVVERTFIGLAEEDSYSC